MKCSECEYWYRWSREAVYGECDRPNLLPDLPLNLMMDIDVTSDDDSGLNITFKTGQDFFCAKFLQKEGV